MGLYDNAWPHVYEEIRRFYPVWYRDVLEMDAIWRAQGVELDGVRATVEALIDNGYIMTADLRTIASLEAFLHINPSPGQTLQERRQVVATYVRGQDHIGGPGDQEYRRGLYFWRGRRGVCARHHFRHGEPSGHGDL